MARKITLVNGKVKVQELEQAGELTFEDRFKAALKATKKRGVRVRQNVRECCRSCITPDKLGMTDEQEKTTPYVYTYGGQGSAYRWIDGTPYYYQAEARGWRYQTDARVNRIYFNHGGPGVQAATILTEEMRRQGIMVEWNGEEYQCPQVITPYGLEEMQQQAVQA